MQFFLTNILTRILANILIVTLLLPDLCFGSVRFSSFNDNYQRSTNLPSISSFTLMGWFKISVDRNAYSPFMSFGDSTGFNIYFVGAGPDGTTLISYNPVADGPNGTNLTVGTWYHVALVCNGTGVGNLKVYLNGVLDSTHNGSALPAAQLLWVASDNNGELFNGDAAAIKIYSAVLTAAEIQQEIFSYRPKRTANLNAWTPILNDTEDEIDYSGSTNNWTVNGPPVTEDGPPISW